MMVDEQEKLTMMQEDISYLKSSLDLIKQIIISDKTNSNKNFCPICCSISEFKPFGDPKRNNVQCPICGSLERHRLVYFLFENRFGKLLKNEQIKLLHFAPEYTFYKYFRKQKNIDYFPVDLNPEIYERKNIHIRDKVNIEQIPYNDCEFDFIYNCHVLEHIPNDIKAMSELYRVLKPNGVCVILVPIKFTFKETLEKEEYNTPELRKKYYGQEDHLRYYSMDIVDRLESVGFKVDVLTSDDIFNFESEVSAYQIYPLEHIFVCTK